MVEKTFIEQGCQFEFEAHKHIDIEDKAENKCPFQCIECKLRIAGSSGFGPPCQCKHGENPVMARLAAAWLVSDNIKKFLACINSSIESAKEKGEL